MTVDVSSSGGSGAVANGTNGAPSKSFAPEGTLTSSVSIYAGPKDNEKKITWLDHEPKDVVEAAENEDTAQHAVITRLQKAEDSRRKYELHSIIIQSPYLKAALGEVLKDYPGVCCELKRLVFEAPF